MLTFEKGDSENLRGKAVLYIHNTSGDNSPILPLNPPYISNVIGAHPSEVFEICEAFGPVPEELKQSAEESYRNRLEIEDSKAEPVSEVLREFEDLADKMNIKDEAMNMLNSFKKFSKKGPLYCNAFILGDNPIKLIDNLQGVEYDQIKLMDVSDIITAKHVLDLTSEIYRIIAKEHMLKRIDTRGMKSSMKSYADMSGDEFKQTFSGLICKLMYQIEGGIEPLDVFTDLKQITRDSPFLDDIERFFQLSKSERNSTNIESMKLIHERIFAVLDEHYEDAAKITKRLRELGFKG